MTAKYYAVLAVVLMAWASWFFRFDLSGFHGITLDRWTGTIILPTNEGEKIDLSAIPTEAERRAQLAAEYAEHGVEDVEKELDDPYADLLKANGARAPGMFDEFEKPAR